MECPLNVVECRRDGAECPLNIVECRRDVVECLLNIVDGRRDGVECRLHTVECLRDIVECPLRIVECPPHREECPHRGVLGAVGAVVAMSASERMSRAPCANDTSALKLDRALMPTRSVAETVSFSCV